MHALRPAAVAAVLMLAACGGDPAPSVETTVSATVAPPDVPADTARRDSTSAPAAASAPEADEAPVATPVAPAPVALSPEPVARAAAGATVTVSVTKDGFVPDRITLPVGVRSRLVFTRTTDATCATSVKGPALGFAETPLPLGEAVAVEVLPAESGELSFACGMDMVSGVVVAQ